MKLLPGEIQVASTQAVLYPPTVKITDTNENEGTEGVLIVTNFKLSFISDQNEKVKLYKTFEIFKKKFKNSIF